jgi:hypothetical protein
VRLRSVPDENFPAQKIERTSNRLTLPWAAFTRPLHQKIERLVSFVRSDANA